jgi:hypothetical protein
MNEENIIRIRDWINQLSDSILSLIRIMVLSKLKNKINYEIKKELIIAGNGPSINETIKKNLNQFQNRKVLCVNMFCTSPYFEQLKPQHYVIVSPNMWGDKPDPRTVANKEKLWNEIGKKTTWHMNLYLPYEAKKTKKWKQQLGKNEKINIIYFNRTPIEGFEWFRHLIFRKGLGMPRPHNVIIPSIFLGINLGFKKIVLIGADHSWLPELTVNKKNEVLVRQKHFYDENLATPEGMIKNNEGSRKLHEVLEKWMISFKSYFILKDYGNSRKVKIVNATPNSFIDAFDKVDFP